MNEAHMPKRSPVMGNRKLGDLMDRRVAGNQSQAAGNRYDINEVAKEDTKTALAKVKAKKAADAVVVDPVVNDITINTGQGL